MLAAYSYTHFIIILMKWILYCWFIGVLWPIKSYPLCKCIIQPIKWYRRLVEQERQWKEIRPKTESGAHIQPPCVDEEQTRRGGQKAHKQIDGNYGEEIWQYIGMLQYSSCAQVQSHCKNPWCGHLSFRRLRVKWKWVCSEDLFKWVFARGDVRTKEEKETLWNQTK